MLVKQNTIVTFCFKLLSYVILSIVRRPRYAAYVVPIRNSMSMACTVLKKFAIAIVMFIITYQFSYLTDLFSGN